MLSVAGLPKSEMKRLICEKSEDKQQKKTTKKGNANNNKQLQERKFFEVSSLEEIRVCISDNLERISNVCDRRMSSVSALVMC